MPNLEHPQDGVHNSAMNEKIAGLLIESIPIICSNTYQSLAESLKIHSIFPLPVPVLQLHLYRTYWFSQRGILRFSVWRFHIIGYTWTLPASSHRQVLQYYIIWNLYWSLYLYLHISRGDADTERRWKPKAGGEGRQFLSLWLHKPTPMPIYRHLITFCYVSFQRETLFNFAPFRERLNFQMI